MAKVDNTDAASFFTNPAVYTQIKNEKNKSRSIKKSGQNAFSRIFNEFRTLTGDELGSMQDLPVSEETQIMLMDEVHSTGSALRDKPCQEEIIRYKQAVRNFMNYIVKNTYALEHEEGLPRKAIPGFTGSRLSDQAERRKPYTKIQVIDKKLEDLAAGILAGQLDQLKLIAGLEEINGLLIDLLQ